MHLPPISRIISSLLATLLLIIISLLAIPARAQQGASKGSYVNPHQILDDSRLSQQPAQVAGDPRFGDPVADPEGYAKRKEAYYEAQRDPNDTGEGRTWWNISPDSEPRARTHDERGKPIQAEQPGMLFGFWELVEIKNEDTSSVDDDLAQLPLGMELHLGYGSTGFSVPSLGFIADWWMDESSTMIYLMPQCEDCQGSPPPFGLSLGENLNAQRLVLLVPSSESSEQQGSATRLTFNKRN